ncbi:c-type cytochrome [Fimbriiglobus ruber]|uniref:Electron transport protein n=1 Tax=Fimbriiglobus ruber TaxID=1908690 RepID=A0A225DH67_9BACT|nr:cytochrome c [Fimbriiglobus ruber]OWK40333.1 electron transport protein [Fimbriiglobus ruber]
MSAVTNPPPESLPTPPAPHHTHHRLHRFKLALLFIAPVIAVVASWGTAIVALDKINAIQKPVSESPPPDGARLYTQNCAYCHGERGDGKGVALLSTQARYFGAEKFKFASTANGVPTDDDLLYLLRHGIPGSAMPEFTRLSEPELRAVIGHVRSLAWKGRYEALWQKAVKDVADGGDDPDPAKISRRVDEQTHLEKPIDIPASIPSATPESIARGRAVYLSDVGGCSKCHGPEGRGDGPQVKDAAFKNENGERASPRNFTMGLFKGGRDPQRLFARIKLGIPGTPMAANPNIPAKDVIDLIHFVQSLSPPPPIPTPETTIVAQKP